jgi:hypothetical protein
VEQNSNDEVHKFTLDIFLLDLTSDNYDPDSWAATHCSAFIKSKITQLK